MTAWRMLAARLHGLFHRRRDAAFDDEIQAHLDLLAQEHERRGLSPDAARQAARRDFGAVNALKDEMRDARGVPWLEDVARDLRVGARTLVRRPAFTAAVVLILALGIGANAAVFSIVDALELRSLPVRAPQQLVHITFIPAGSTGNAAESVSYSMVRGLDQQRAIFASVAGFGGGTNFDVGQPGAVRRVPGVMVTGGYYETLGIEPALGRLLRPDDDEAGAPAVAVISDGYWARAFGRSPDVIGRHSWLPARRASLINPIEALRHD